MAEKKLTQSEKNEKIRELEEKVKKLEGHEKIRFERGVSGSLLHGLNNLIPGIGKLVIGLEKSPAFQERLKEIDKEVERKLKEQGTSEVKPRIEHGLSIRPIRSQSGEAPREPIHKRKKRGTENLPIERKEPLVDIFEEKDAIRVVAEMPGIDEEDLHIKIEGNRHRSFFTSQHGRDKHDGKCLQCQGNRGKP